MFDAYHWQSLSERNSAESAIDDIDVGNPSQGILLNSMASSELCGNESVTDSRDLARSVDSECIDLFPEVVLKHSGEENNKSTEKPRARFACPFYKNNALRHHRCAECQFARVRDVKQHLRRKHQEASCFYCPNCHEMFETHGKQDERARKERDDHVEAENCSQVDLSSVDWIDDKADFRESPTYAVNNHVEQWKHLYRTIFPEQCLLDDPQFPFFDPLHLLVQLKFYLQVEIPKATLTGESKAENKRFSPEKSFMVTFQFLLKRFVTGCGPLRDIIDNGHSVEDSFNGYQSHTGPGSVPAIPIEGENANQPTAARTGGPISTQASWPTRRGDHKPPTQGDQVCNAYSASEQCSLSAINGDNDLSSQTNQMHNIYPAYTQPSWTTAMNGDNDLITQIDQMHNACTPRAQLSSQAINSDNGQSAHRSQVYDTYTPRAQPSWPVMNADNNLPIQSDQMRNACRTRPQLSWQAMDGNNGQLAYGSQVYDAYPTRIIPQASTGTSIHPGNIMPGFQNHSVPGHFPDFTPQAHDQVYDRPSAVPQVEVRPSDGQIHNPINNAWHYGSAIQPDVGGGRMPDIFTHNMWNPMPQTPSHELFDINHQEHVLNGSSW